MAMHNDNISMITKLGRRPKEEGQVHLKGQESSPEETLPLCSLIGANHIQKQEIIGDFKDTKLGVQNCK